LSSAGSASKFTLENGSANTYSEVVQGVGREERNCLIRHGHWRNSHGNTAFL